MVGFTSTPTNWVSVPEASVRVWSCMMYINVKLWTWCRVLCLDDPRQAWSIPSFQQFRSSFMHDLVCVYGGLMINLQIVFMWGWMHDIFDTDKCRLRLNNYSVHPPDNLQKPGVYSECLADPLLLSAGGLELGCTRNQLEIFRAWENHNEQAVHVEGEKKEKNCHTTHCTGTH